MSLERSNQFSEEVETFVRDYISAVRTEEIGESVGEIEVHFLLNGDLSPVFDFRH